MEEEIQEQTESKLNANEKNDSSLIIKLERINNYEERKGPIFQISSNPPVTQIASGSTPASIAEAVVQPSKIEEERKDSIDTNKKKLSYLERDPVRMKYLKESLKQYHVIKKTKFLDRKKKILSEEDIDVCKCIPSAKPNPNDEKNKNVSYNCGIKCWNRSMCTECDINTCPCGSLCQNRRFQMQEFAPVYPFPTPGKGWGLSAGELIKKGDFVMQYIGEVFNIYSEFGKQKLKEYSKSNCTYLMKTTNNEVIDPTYKGNMARFINHSCEPNCITEKWHVFGEIYVGIFALRDIEENEELTFDYKFDSYHTPLTKCLCGTPSCKGYLGIRPTQYTVEEWEEKLNNMPCSICGQNVQDDDDKLLLCDECNKGFHTFCLEPALEEIPEGEWFCDDCKRKFQHQAEEMDIVEDLEKLPAKVKESQDEERKQKEFKERKRRIILSETKKRREHESDNEEEGRERNLNLSNDLYRLQVRLEREETQNLMEINNIKEKEDELGMIKIRKKTKLESIEGAGIKESVMEEVSKHHHHAGKEANHFDDEWDRSRKKKEEMQNILKIAEEKLNDKLTNESGLLAKLNLLESLENSHDTQMQKRVMTINNVELNLYRVNFLRKSRVKVFWENGRTKDQHDWFIKNIEFSIIGSETQISIIEDIFAFISKTVKDLKKLIGIVEAQITVPALSLKKIIGYNHQNLQTLERTYSVNISYDKKFFNDECYPMHTEMTLIVKGTTDNIIQVQKKIQEICRKLVIKRIFLNQCDTRIVLFNINILKKKIKDAEFRVNRDQPFKEINHPFFFIHYKEKELLIIGFKEEVEQASQVILSLIDEERAKQGGTILTYNYLLPLWCKVELSKIKGQVEKDVKGCKIMIYDPTHPRKNLTLSITGTADVIEKTKQRLVQKLDSDENLKEAKFESFESFQDQMNFQITKYLFKYLQNSFLAGDVAFMKSWDIISSDFRSKLGWFLAEEAHEKQLADFKLNSSENDCWYWDTIKDSTLRDYELLLYIVFVCRLTREDILSKFGLSIEELVRILKVLLYKVINNNSNLTRNFRSVFSFEAENLFDFIDTKYISNSEVLKAIQEVKLLYQQVPNNNFSYLNNSGGFSQGEGSYSVSTGLVRESNFRANSKSPTNISSLGDISGSQNSSTRRIATDTNSLLGYNNIPNTSGSGSTSMRFYPTSNYQGTSGKGFGQEGRYESRFDQPAPSTSRHEIVGNSIQANGPFNGGIFESRFDKKADELPSDIKNEDNNEGNPRAPNIRLALQSQAARDKVFAAGQSPRKIERSRSRSVSNKKDISPVKEQNVRDGAALNPQKIVTARVPGQLRLRDGVTTGRKKSESPDSSDSSDSSSSSGSSSSNSDSSSSSSSERERRTSRSTSKSRSSRRRRRHKKNRRHKPRRKRPSHSPPSKKIETSTNGQIGGFYERKLLRKNKEEGLGIFDSLFQERQGNLASSSIMNSEEGPNFQKPINKKIPRHHRREKSKHRQRSGKNGRSSSDSRSKSSNNRSRSKKQSSGSEERSSRKKIRASRSRSVDKGRNTRRRKISSRAGKSKRRRHRSKRTRRHNHRSKHKEKRFGDQRIFRRHRPESRERRRSTSGKFAAPEVQQRQSIFEEYNPVMSETLIRMNQLIEQKKKFEAPAPIINEVIFENSKELELNKTAELVSIPEALTTTNIEEKEKSKVAQASVEIETITYPAEEKILTKEDTPKRLEEVEERNEEPKNESLTHNQGGEEKQALVLDIRIDKGQIPEAVEEAVSKQEILIPEKLITEETVKAEKRTIPKDAEEPEKENRDSFWNPVNQRVGNEAIKMRNYSPNKYGYKNRKSNFFNDHSPGGKHRNHFSNKNHRSNRKHSHDNKERKRKDSSRHERKHNRKSKYKREASSSSSSRDSGEDVQESRKQERSHSKESRRHKLRRSKSRRDENTNRKNYRRHRGYSNERGKPDKRDKARDTKEMSDGEIKEF